MVQGLPVTPVPGSNIFITGHDETTPDHGIICHPISTREALHLAYQGLRILSNLFDEV